MKRREGEVLWLTHRLTQSKTLKQALIDSFYCNKNLPRLGGIGSSERIELVEDKSRELFSAFFS